MSRSRKRGRTESKQSLSGPGAPLPQRPLPASRHRSVLIGAALVALAILAVYCNSLLAPFIFDDRGAVRDNSSIRRLWAIGSVLWPPAGGTGLRNRPVVNLSLAINYALGGQRVFAYHLFNLGVHIVAALTLLGAVRRTLLLPRFADRFGARATWHATAVALFWGLHPLNTEAVTYTIQRCESMAAMFYLLTLYCCIRGYGSARPNRWFAAAIGSCFLGIGCKETVVTAPFVILLYDRVFVARSWKETLRRRWGLYGGLAATWLLLGVLMARYWGTQESAVGYGWGITLAEYARTQLWAVCRYLRLALWPSGLVFDYGIWVARAPGEIVPCAIVVTLLVIATVAAYVRWPWVGYLGTCFLAILAPTSSVVPLVTQPVAERRMYLPLAAVIALVVFVAGAAGKHLLDRMALPDPVRRRRAMTLAVAAMACVAAALGCLTVLRNRDYRSELALWDDTVRKRPANPRAYLGRGGAYGELGAWDKKIADCSEALRLDPEYVEAYIDRAGAFDAKGYSLRALEDYSRAIVLRPRLAITYNNRGLVYSHAGDYARAAEDFAKAVELRPDYAEAFNNRGQMYGRAGDYDRAAQDLAKAIELNPALAEAYNNRGLMFANRGDFDPAVRDFSKAIELKPDYTSAYNSRALAFCKLKEYDKAWADVKTLEKLGIKITPEFLKLFPPGWAAQPKK